MALPALRIAVLHYQPRGEAPDPVVENISTALKELGHEAIPVAVHDRVTDMIEDLERSRCDIVFNACETFADDYRLEVNVAALMEMARIPHTGSGTAGLLLAQDKIVTKQLLGYHEVQTPNFATMDGEAFETHGMLRFPLVVKPSRSDASIGIGRHSVVQDWDELTKRVREIRRELHDEALAEEYIEGREIYVSVLGSSTRPEILPLVELDFGRWAVGAPRISDREVKFGPETEGSPRLVLPHDIGGELRARIERDAIIAYRALKLRDYARIDFRISTAGEPYILEANPNPYLEKVSELAMAAKERGLAYPQLIGRILESAAGRYRLHKKTGPESKVEVPSPAGAGA
jgi:D-alanine-D-alanine ligase